MEIGVQTKNVISDEKPAEGFARLKACGFDCVDFSLNEYLKNSTLYGKWMNDFFDMTIEELKQYFAPYKSAAKESQIRIHQMHMPYPNYVPDASQEFNDYLWQVVAVKSLQICSFMECKYIVVHGAKLVNYYGSEEAEWEKTEEFLESIAPLAKDLGITICIENIYTRRGGHIIEGPCCNAVKAARRIDAMNDKFGAEVLGFCFDTGHANLVGLDFEKFITTLGSRLKVLHIHDNDGVRDLHQIPFAYTRTRQNIPSTDWVGFVRGLQKIHFDGVLNFETAPALDAFPEELWAEVLSLIAGIGKYFDNRINCEPAAIDLA